MIVKSVLVVVASFGVVSFVGGPSQELTEEVQEQEVTRLEELADVRGEVIVRGFSRIGSVKGKYGGFAQVEVKEFRAISSGRRELGITVEVDEDKKYSRTSSSFVDFDELEGLIAGLDYIATLDRSTTRLANFQADFHSVGGLVLSTASSGSKIIFAVRCGKVGGQQILFDSEAIPEFRDLIVKANERLLSISK